MRRVLLKILCVMIKTESVSYSINNIYFCVSYMIHIKGNFGNIFFMNFYLG